MTGIKYAHWILPKMDETNWRQRGYFRYLAAKSKSQDAEKASKSSKTKADDDLLTSLIEAYNGYGERT